jgi:hypothetical protein
MTIRRWQGILLGLLLIQVLLVGFVYWPRQSAAGGGAPLVEADLEQQVIQMTIRDEEQNELRLLKGSEGWVLPDAGNFPADPVKVESFLTKLASISTVSSVAQTADSYRRLKVAEQDFVRQIDLALEGGRHAVLYLGSSPSFGAVHVRREGDPTVYLTTKVAAYDAATTAGSWIDAVYLDVPPEDINAVTISNGSGSWTFVKLDDETWSLTDLSGGEVVDQSAVSTLLNRISILRMSEPVDHQISPAYGLDTPSANITIRTAEQNYMIAVGALDEDADAYYVKGDHSPYVVRVSASNLESVVTNAREDYLIPPPTPTAGDEDQSSP